MDRQAILAALITGKVHKIALSFVREAKDIVEARELVRVYLGLLAGVKAGRGPNDSDSFWGYVANLIPPGTVQTTRQWLMNQLADVTLVEPEIDAKIERREAVLAIDSILDVADGVMVARGDLIMAVGSHNLLMAQTKIVRAARERNKPVIVATGLLSGVSNGVVPHSSAIDVGTVTLLFADAAQLSNESVIGDPFETIPHLKLHLAGGELAAFDSPLTPNFEFGTATTQYLTDSRELALPLPNTPGHYVITQNAHAAGRLAFRRGVRVIQVNSAPPNRTDKNWYLKVIGQAGYPLDGVTVVKGSLF